MTDDYKCGHSHNIIILDDSPLSFSAYLTWSESVGLDGTRELCWDCWNKKEERLKNQYQKLSLAKCTIIPISERDSNTLTAKGLFGNK